MRRTRWIVPVVLMALGFAPVGCSSDDKKSDADKTTTTTAEAGPPCDVQQIAQRALNQASLSAVGADPTIQTNLRDRLDELETTVPMSLKDEVAVIRATFEAAFAAGDGDDNPFSTDEYLAADQAVRAYVDSGCTVPSI